MPKLADITELIVDSEHKTAPTQVSGFPMIRTPNIGRGRFLLDGVRRVSKQTYEAWTRRAVPSIGDLILAREAPVGNVAIVKAPLQPCLGQRTVLIRPDPARVNGDYLTYLLLGDQIQHRMHAVASGATVPHLNMSDIRSLELPELPTLVVQRKIASVLSAYDDLIANNTRRIEVLEQMARAIYREWFVEFRYPGHESVPLVESELGPIPKKWQAITLSDVTSTQYGFTASTSSDPVGPQFLRGMDFNKQPWIDWSAVPYCEIDETSFDKYAVRRDDILVIRMADPGKATIVEKDVEAVFASYLVRVSPDAERLQPLWLFYYLSSPHYQSYITGASTGTTRKSASAGVLTGSRVALPPRRLQELFTDQVNPLRRLLNLLLDINASLRSTRDLLLPRLVSGEVDVSDLDIDIGIVA